jgi:hypothetical protein
MSYAQDKMLDGILEAEYREIQQFCVLLSDSLNDNEKITYYLVAELMISTAEVIKADIKARKEET